MAIHYRSYFKGEPRSQIYRSLERARKDRIDPDAEVIAAFPSRATALDQTKMLRVPDNSPAPEILDASKVRKFLASHDNIRSQPMKYSHINKTVRQALEQKYKNFLFGFGPGGEAIWAQQFISVSGRYVRYQCPIYVNGTKTTRKTLVALFPENYE